MKSALLGKGYEVMKGLVPQKMAAELFWNAGAVCTNPELFTDQFSIEELYWDSCLKTHSPLTIVDAAIELVQSALAQDIRDMRFCQAQFSAFLPGHSGWNTFHLDGAGQLFRGERSFDELSDFSILVGITLVDLTGPNRGNLVVVPNGPNLVAEWFRQHQSELSENPLPGACEQFPAGSGHQLLLEPGDVAVLHYAMPHRVAPNEHAPRPMLYLRFGQPAVKGLAGYLDPAANF